MLAAAIPEDERERLASVRALDVLDSPPEAEFDNLALLACMACQMPIAGIQLIDAERVWAKAMVGLQAPVDVPRSVSICAHAILGDELFEIADLTADRRFADHPLVVGPSQIRCYGGVPIRLADGSKVGILCVMDGSARQFTPTQREILRCLADAAGHAFEGRRALRRVQRAEVDGARAAVVLEHSVDAVVEISATGTIVRWNPAATRLLGYEPQEILGCRIEQLVPMACRGEALDSLAVLRTGMAHSYDTSRLHRDGSEVPVSITHVGAYDGAGRLCGATKFIRDRSAQDSAMRKLLANEATLRHFYQATPAILHSTDAQGRIIAVSDAWLALMGMARKDVIARRFIDFLTPASKEYALSEAVPRFIAAGQCANVAYQMVASDGRIIDVLLSAKLQRDANGAYSHSLTAVQEVGTKLPD